MVNKRTKLVLSLILVAGVVATALTFGDVAAQGPTATSTTNPKAAPATATKTAAPANTATNTPVSKAAPATATATLTKAIATTAATLTKAVTSTPTKTATPVKVLAKRASPAFQFTYSAGLGVQNLVTTTLANITITYYNQDGTVNATVPDTIPAGSNKAYFPVNAMNGSAVISSDQPVASIVNVQGNSGVVVTSFAGATQGSTTVNLPLLIKNGFGFNTWFNVQNAGSIAATVYVTYTDGTFASQVINPNASKTFDQATETHSGVVFSAKMTSAQPIVVTVIEEDATTLSSYSGFGSSSTNPVMPGIIQNLFTIQTGIAIQNTGTAPTTVTVSYTPSAAGTACTESLAIGPGAFASFALNAFVFNPQTPGHTCVFGAAFVGSGRVTSNTATQPLVAIVNQLTPGVNADAYNAFDPNSGTQRVFLPQIVDRFFAISSGINIMNVGSGSTTITCTYTGTGYTSSALVSVGQSLSDALQNKIAPDYIGSGTCTATNSGDKIVGIVNQVRSIATDGFSDYSGFNQ